MHRPGQANEIEGWEAFVHILRWAWWVPAACLAVATVAIVLMFMDASHDPQCAFDGNRVTCEPHWTDRAGAAAAPLLSVSVMGLALLAGHWLRLRIGAARRKPCPACGREALPVHAACRGWWARGADFDAATIKERLSWGWRSLGRRTSLVLAVVAAAGLAAVVSGATMERPDTTTRCDATGFETICDEPPPHRGPAIMAIGFLLLVSGVSAWGALFFFRVVRPSFRPPDPTGPPGGW